MSMVLVDSQNNQEALKSHGWYKRQRPAQFSGGELRALAKAAKQAFIDMLVHWLENRGMTAAELARAIDVNQSAISNWKKGSNFPSPEQFGKIAEALDVPLYLLFWDPTDVRRDDQWLHRIADLAGSKSHMKDRYGKFYGALSAVRLALDADDETFRREVESARSRGIDSDVLDEIIHDRQARRAREQEYKFDPILLTLRQAEQERIREISMRRELERAKYGKPLDAPLENNAPLKKKRSKKKLT